MQCACLRLQTKVCCMSSECRVRTRWITVSRQWRLYGRRTEVSARPHPSPPSPPVPPVPRRPHSTTRPALARSYPCCIPTFLRALVSPRLFLFRRRRRYVCSPTCRCMPPAAARPRRDPRGPPDSPPSPPLALQFRAARRSTSRRGRSARAA